MQRFHNSNLFLNVLKTDKETQILIWKIQILEGNNLPDQILGN